jgi:LacI family transcriptional regulator
MIKEISMKVTMRDIAKASGFSNSTISRVLNNHPNIDTETKNKIINVMRELNYKPEKVEKSIKSKKDNIISIILGDINNPFYSEITSVIESDLYKAGYMAVLCNSNYQQDREKKYLEVVLEFKFSGVILISALGDEEVVKKLIKKNIPVIFVNRYLPSINTSVVSTDDYKGTYMATKYLIELGHKRIGYLKGPQTSSASKERERAFINIMNEYSLKLNSDDIYEGNLKPSSGYEFGKHLLENKSDISAVVCGNDLMAVGLIDCFLDNGKSIPDDLSVIGYDDSPAAVHGKVKLSTINISVKDIGSTVANMILTKISNKEDSFKRIIVEPKLVIRNSTKKFESNP